MKIERTDKEYGGGGGRAIFESDLFRVVVWKLSKGIRTTITSNLHGNCEINFDGNIAFDSDEACMEQFTHNEIIEMIEHQKKVAFRAGEQSKIREIKSCFK